MKNLTYFLLILLSGLLFSCVKDPETTCSETLRPGDEKTEYSLKLNISQDGLPVKALSSEQAKADDGLNRLDLYIFYENDPYRNFHVTLAPDPTGATSYSVSGPKDERVGVLAFGNLDEDTAEFLEGKTLDQMYNENNPEAWLVLSAGNFDFDSIMMAGAAMYDFKEDGIIDIHLKRLMFRIDVNQLTVDFDDEELKGKEVKVKNIVLANCLNYYVPLESNSIGHFYTWFLFFGQEMELEGAFGGVEYGFDYYRNRPDGWNPAGSFTVDGPGKLNGTFPYVLNNNWQKPKGILNIDAEGILRDMTVQTYDTASDEGLIVSSGDNSDTPHTIAVDKYFYGLLGAGSFYGTTTSDFDKQTLTPRLIVELLIDGQSSFYPIEISMPQPNTIYEIENITIKSSGSEYSNFYEKKYNVQCSVSIVPWQNIDVPNINVGYDPLTGETVESY